MNFRIVRDPPASNGLTTGQLFAGDLSLFTLELPWNQNAPTRSCIPPGRYRCVLAFSNRYQRIMPRLLNVPERDGILIHSGNVAADTSGCVLVGLRQNDDGTLRDSRAALGLFFEWLARSARDGDVWCDVYREGEDIATKRFDTT